MTKSTKPTVKPIVIMSSDNITGCMASRTYEALIRAGQYERADKWARRHNHLGPFDYGREALLLAAEYVEIR